MVGGGGCMCFSGGWMGEGGENHDVKGAFENAQQMNLKLVCLRRKEVFVNFVDMMTTVSKKKKKKEKRSNGL